MAEYDYRIYKAVSNLRSHTTFGVWGLCCPLQISPGKNQISGESDTLRDVQISIFLKSFQIPKGYLKPIAFLNPVSNHWPKIVVSDKEKKANPYSEIHYSGFGYHPDIKNEF